MPDYNPAVATGINTEGPDLSKTLGTINQLQIGQAHLGLYNLQALQQQRQYGALQATAAHIRDNPGDSRGALQVYYGAGGDPSGGPAIVNSLATANATAATPGGMLPSEYSQRVGAQKTLAEISGVAAKSDVAQKEDAAQAAASYFASGDRSSIIAHAQKYHDINDPRGGGAMGIALLANLPKDQFDRVAASALGANVPAEKLTGIFKGGDTDINNYNNPNLPMAQRVGAAPVLRQPGEVKRIEEYTAQNTKDLTEANEQYRNANVAQFRLGDLRKNLNNLGGLLAPGAGFNERVALARALDTAGIDAGFTKDELASAQASVKGSTYLGFDLAKTLGSREAAMIVQQSIGVQPGGQLSAEGNQRVWASLSVANQYNKDHATFVRQYLKQNPNAVPGDADAAFSEAHPVSSYINDVDKVVKIQGDKNKSGGYLVDDLSAGKGSAKEFDEHYGGNYSRYFGK